MNKFSAQPNFDQLYPVPVVRANAISRMQEKRLGDLCFDAATAQFLGEENVGVFAGGCNFERLYDRLVSLDESSTGGRWVVVLPTKQVAAKYYAKWACEVGAIPRAKNVPEPWQSENLIFAVPEALKSLSAELTDSRIGIAGILVIDPYCMIHKARGFRNGNFRVRNDRPQLIVDFRANLSYGLWSPPVMFFAEKPAMSVNTVAMLGPYCLEALRYVDGRYLRMGDPPVEFLQKINTQGHRVNLPVH